MTPCPASTYNPSQGQSNCTSCPIGWYCRNISMTSPVMCPAGKYCPLGTAEPEFCPVGTFSNQLNLGASSDCESCTPGSYCSTNGLTSVSGSCSAGYYCGGGAKVSNPVGDTSNGRDNNACPIGYYCPTGSSTPLPCPQGSYSSVARIAGNLSSDFICTACPAKYACNGTALTAATGLCYAGYFCKLGAPYPNAYCSSSKCANRYGICPVGYYCPAGTDNPISCPAGTYNNRTGASTCTSCPAGYYCDGTSPTTYVSCLPGVSTKVYHLIASPSSVILTSVSLSFMALPPYHKPQVVIVLLALVQQSQNVHQALIHQPTN